MSDDDAIKDRQACIAPVWQPTPFMERRAHQHERLVALLGTARAALEVVNAVDQIGVDDALQRCEIVDAVIASIYRGQRWATGEQALQVITCPTCEGTKVSRSGRGCKACRKTGRKQVPCRVCAEAGARPTHCIACQGYGALDPIQDRGLILKQHQDWWERMTKMSEKKDEHGAPAEDRAHRQGAFVIEDITMHWDQERGDNVSGIGTPEYPFATFHAARDAGMKAIEARRVLETSSVAIPLCAECGSAMTEYDGGLPGSGGTWYCLECAGKRKLPPTSPMPRVIAIALLRAQRKIRKVAKESRNDGDDYAYTNAETIIEEARQALLDAGLCVTLFDWDTDGGEELMVTWMYIHESGEQHVCQPVPMPIVLDGGRDKRAADKALATALTYCESQWLRTALQIPRVGKAEDADARSDSGEKRQRARKQDDGDRSPLSTELNDAVLAMNEAIESAKTEHALGGVGKRLDSLRAQLPTVVYERVQSAIQTRLLAIREPKS